MRLGRRAREEPKSDERHLGDVPHLERAVQRYGIADTLHLPQAQRQAQPQFLRTALIIAQALVIRGLTPTATQRLLTRLVVLAPRERQEAKPIDAADRHAKQELTTRVRRVRPITRRLAGRSASEAEVVRDYGAAVRRALIDNEHPRTPRGAHTPRPPQRYGRAP